MPALNSKVIKWSPEERSLLVHALAVYLRSVHKPASAITEHGWFAFYIARAQSVLPDNRKRNIQTINMVPWLLPALQQMMPTEEPTQLSTRSLAGQPAHSTDVSAFVAANLEEVIRVLEATHLVIPKSECVVRMTHREASVKEKKTRVLIVGCKPNQATSIIDAFGSTLDLIFHYSGQGLASELPKADHCIAMIGFLAHKVDDRLKTYYKGRYQATMGGVSSVFKICRELVLSSNPPTSSKTT